MPTDPKPQMTAFEQNLLWRFVAPLAIASVIGAGGSIIATAKLSVTVDNLNDAQHNNVSKDWAKSQMQFLQFQIKSNRLRIDSNSRAIDKNADQLRRHSRAQDSALLPLPWNEPFRTPRTARARHTQANPA